MPVDVQHVIHARDIKRGDHLLGSGGAKVTKVDPKRVNTEITIDNRPMPMRFKLDESVIVVRPEPTPEERAEQQRKYAYHSILQLFRSAHQKHTQARAKMAAQLAAGATPSWAAYEELIKAEATYQLWLSVDHVLKVCARKGEPLTLPAAMIEMRRLFTEQMVDSWYDAMSKSTSVMSNVLKDAEHAAKLEFIRELKWINIENAA